jgi:WSC domain
MRKMLLLLLTLSSAWAFSNLATAQIMPPNRPPAPGHFFPPRSNGAFACLVDIGAPLNINSGAQDLTGRTMIMGFKSINLTNDQCRSSCASQNFALAGTQSGAFCFCGNNTDALGPPTNACTTGCVGYPGEICGGNLANSVSLTGAAGFVPPPVPAPPANGGQCVTDVQGPGYRHFEIQTWTVSGPPVPLANGGKQYPMYWNSTGRGAYRAVNGAQTDLTTWILKGGSAVTYQTTPIASDGNLNFAEVSNAGTATIQAMQQQFISGIPQTPGRTGGYWGEFPHPVVFAPPLNPSNLVAQQTFTADYNHKFGYVQPAAAGGTVVCTWNVIR